MRCPEIPIPEAEIPRAAVRWAQHALDTYASETNKVLAGWAAFADADLGFRPHPKSSTVAEMFKHQLLSERRFFAEFLGLPEPPPQQILPAKPTVAGYRGRMVDLARPRLAFLAAREESWWLGETAFFDVRRERVWIFWRRVLHTAHHRGRRRFHHHAGRGQSKIAQFASVPVYFAAQFILRLESAFSFFVSSATSWSRSPRLHASWMSFSGIPATRPSRIYAGSACAR